MNTFTEYGPELTVVGIVGFLIPFIAAVVGPIQWSKPAKRWLVIVLSFVLALFALFGVGAFTDLAIDSPQQVVGVILGIIGLAQTVYTALKPVLEKIELATSTEKQKELASKPVVQVKVDGDTIAEQHSAVPIETDATPPGPDYVPRYRAEDSGDNRG